MTAPRLYTPRPFFGQAFDHLANVERCALWAGMGMGKTSIVGTFLHCLHDVWGEDAPTLILGPKRVARDTWPAEFKKWTHLAHMDVAVAVGDKGEREAALKRDVPIVTTNYDNLQWLRDYYLDRGRAWPFRTVVPDEATRLKSFRLQQGGVRAAALGQFAHKEVKRWINLTGTPASNGLIDLWGQTWFLDQGARLGRSFSAFQDRWFGFKRAKDAVSGKVEVQPVIMPFAQEQIMEKLRDVCLTLDPKDWFDLKEPIRNVIEVDLPPSARKHYREMERDLFTELKGGFEVEAFSAAAKTMKCLQAASGAMYLDAERYGAEVAIEIHDAKLEALESVVEEAGGMPVLVAIHFKSDRTRILRSIGGAVDLATDEGMAAFKAGKAAVGVAHPASLGHGIDGLQDVTNIVVFFSQWWDLEQHDQMVERVGAVRQLQSGHDRPVFIHYLVARNTIDELVMARRDTKRSVQDLLLEYMKRKT